MDPLVEQKVYDTLQNVTKFRTTTGTLYIEGYINDDYYLISKQESYIITKNEQYVLFGGNVTRCIDYLNSIV